MKTACPKAGLLGRYCIFCILFIGFCSHSSIVFSQDLLSNPPTIIDTSISTSDAKHSIQSYRLFKNNPTLKHPILKSNALTYDLNTYELENLYKVAPESFEILLPVNNGQTIVASVNKVNLYTDDFTLTTSHSRPVKETGAPVFYRGAVLGSNNAIVSLSIMGEKIRMLIIDDNGAYQLSKNPNKRKEYLFFNSQKVENSRDFDCFTNDITNEYETTVDKVSSEKSSTASCIPIFVETDLATYNFFNNNVSEVEFYIGSLMNEVATIYLQEGIDISLSQIHIATLAQEDWSANINFADEALEEFARNRRNNYQGRLAHFITHRNLLGGKAWTNVLCNSYSTFEADWDGDGEPETHHYGPYAVSSLMGEGIQDYPIYSWDVTVFAHEMGHNLGASHTHACVWGPDNKAIDDCVTPEGSCTLIESPVPESELGTIMSYCHLTETGIDLSKGFGTLPGALILQNVTNSSCALSCDIIEIPGCMDDSYHNYNPDANVNDGSCNENCSDNIKNGDETGIDCGGLLCQPCQEICQENYLQLKFILDSHPTETTWILIDSLTGDTIEVGGPYGGMALDTIISEFCLPYGSYSFTIYDQFGDGICCTDHQYQALDKYDNVLFQGGSFGTSATHNIRFIEGECPTTLALQDEDLSGMYMAGDRLTASNSQTMGETVLFMSPNVEINQEFVVQFGTELTVSNSGCN